MDRRRRRYVPDAEGLEGRVVLSAAGTLSAAVPAETTAAGQRAGSGANRQERPLTEAQEQARQEVIQMRLQRIERLPAFLRLLDPARPLPDEAVATIQQELRGLVGQLRPPAPGVTEGFVDMLRDAIAQSSVKTETVTTLNYAAERLLISAGAPEASASRIASSMTELARTASSSNRPVVVMTNDYALVLQTAMGVGRPITRADLAAPRASATISAGIQNPGLGAGGRMF